jgi:hypothetical protein
VKKFFVSVLLSFICATALAAESDENLVAIGQGVSSPNSTSTVNYSSGFTSENPVGVLYQKSLRLSLQYDQGDAPSKGYGAELGAAGKSAGAAVGYYKRDCTGCEGRFAASVAVAMSSFGLGLRVEEENYTLGMLFGVHDTHRFGVVAGVDDSGGAGNKITSYGLGYSYVSSDFTLTLDASKRQHENTAANNDILILTPGISVRASSLQLTVSDRIVMDNTNKTRTDDVWFGVGFGGKSWHLVGYSDYVNDLALVLSFYF